MAKCKALTGSAVKGLTVETRRPRSNKQATLNSFKSHISTELEPEIGA